MEQALDKLDMERVKTNPISKPFEKKFHQQFNKGEKSRNSVAPPLVTNFAPIISRLFGHFKDHKNLSSLILTANETERNP